MIHRVASVLLRIVPVLILVSVGTAILTELVPGDPAVAVVGAEATPEQYAAVRESLGLDRSWFARYFDWLGGLLHGDLGRTLVPPVQDVATLIASRLPVTLEIAVLSVLLALAIAVPVGTWSAYRYGQVFDRVASGVSFAVISLPSFLLALIMIYFAVFRPEWVKVALLAACSVAVLVLVGATLGSRGARVTANSRRTIRLFALGVAVAGIALAVILPDFPRQGFARIGDTGLAENLRTVLLPVLVLGVAEGAQLTRLLRSDMATTLNDDFVLSARARGMPLRHILIKEALRPSTFSLVTVAGISFGRLLGGTVIVETIFRLPGMGTLIVDSVAKKEFMVLQAAVLVVAALYVLVNALVDISYLYLDPRTRHVRV
ncbi:ABC transporter permease [Rhodococcus sp. USK10]|uniref:ABC transporter permease n=1 Tax=Rhodococcus sp. USK10 TaxID=2789739 RepID=UPI001C5FE02E|nr:ABC transporter permease [Rhodococcus sp. USK10]QYB07463.1 ABC transporter permease [Rhodococcus sp. USK10]